MRSKLVTTVVLALVLTACGSETASNTPPSSPATTAVSKGSPAASVSAPSPGSARNAQAYYESDERKKLIEPAFRSVRGKMVESIQAGDQLGGIEKYRLSIGTDKATSFSCPPDGTPPTYLFGDTDYSGPVAFCKVRRDIWLLGYVKNGFIDESSVVGFRLGDVTVIVGGRGVIGGLYTDDTGRQMSSTDEKTVDAIQAFDKGFVTALELARKSNFGGS